MGAVLIHPPCRAIHVTRHALILGNNLTGLVTAYRLLHYGFHISLIDIPHCLQPTDQLIGARESGTLSSSNHVSTAAKHQTIPFVLHGFYHQTWALLQELSVEWPIQPSQSVGLEFGGEEGKPITLPPPLRLSWVPPLTRLLFVKGLSWRDRWHVINFLEKQWEEHRLPQHYPDTESAETWLIAAQQSESSRTHFWNPLCRFFLNCDLPDASLDVFIEVLSRFWFGKSHDAATFLMPPETLENLETALRQFLNKKGVTFHTSDASPTLQTNAEGIHAVEWSKHRLQAQIYISTLPPQDLLALLPERALARYASLSSLAHIPVSYALAIQVSLPDLLLPPRLILHEDPFDWITCMPRAPFSSPETVITCVILRDSIAHVHTEQWLIDNAWRCLQRLFNLSSTQMQVSCKPQIIQPVGPLYPCLRGTRTHRPLPQAPILNLFLAGPWMASNLPSSLESSIHSANACAATVASTLYGTLD